MEIRVYNFHKNKWTKIKALPKFKFKSVKSLKYQQQTALSKTRIY